MGATRRGKSTFALSAITAVFVIHCGGSSTTDILDPNAADAAATKDGASSTDGSSSTTADGSTSVDASRDAPSGRDAGEPCVPSSSGSGSNGDSCGDGLSCLCCGSAGPKEICLCTTKCSTQGQCTDPGRPSCNHVDGQPGICTPTGFNCCWLCQ